MWAEEEKEEEEEHRDYCSQEQEPIKRRRGEIYILLHNKITSKEKVWTCFPI